MVGLLRMHVGRSWSGHWVEDECPCPKAPCGLIVMSTASPECEQHDGTRTIRQSHFENECPGG